MSLVNRGLDLGKMGETTDAERRAFREFYDRMQGGKHPGLEFYLNNDPDAMKLYRDFADSGTPRALEGERRAGGGGFLSYYALSGYVRGIQYLVHIKQKNGLTKAQVIESLAVDFLYCGPRGSETIAEALKDYPWIEPESPAVFPEHWSVDPDAFRSGLDFSTKELTADQLQKVEAWYMRTLGEVPRSVRFAAKHNPRLLKAYRNRFENTLRTLPKQVMPSTLLHYNVIRSHGPGIRENVLLARAFGMTKTETLRSIFSPLINAGMETLTLVDEVAGEIFDSWPS